MIVFGSRGSDLALAQTRQVASRLRAASGEDFRIEVIETKGDRKSACSSAQDDQEPGHEARIQWGRRLLACACRVALVLAQWQAVLPGASSG